MTTRIASTLCFHGGVGCLLLSALTLAHAGPPPAADRAAIMAMQGEYSIDFSFQETVPLAPDYQRAEPYRSGGNEVVILLEDSPQRIVLQHVLLHVPSGHVTKHWRQDWIYEAPRRWEFTTEHTWRWRALADDEIEGRWTQCVYEVSDAPRYCGSGRWIHADGISTWTSGPSWRPLPRRDYTKRQDYNALAAINRHTITPGGWSHEQDNTKAIRHEHGDTVSVIVREFGFNEYRRTTAIDFSPAYAYWTASADYWARVRTRWQQRLQEAAGLRLATERDGMGLIVPLFQYAQRVIEGDVVADAELDALFDHWVMPLDDE